MPTSWLGALLYQRESCLVHFALGATYKVTGLSGCHEQTLVLNTVLPCCRFMCTPHWQLFYLGVSTVLGGQGYGPQPSDTSLCCPLLQ